MRNTYRARKLRFAAWQFRRIGPIDVQPLWSKSLGCHSPLTMFTKQVSGPDSLDSPSCAEAEQVERTRRKDLVTGRIRFSVPFRISPGSDQPCWLCFRYALDEGSLPALPFDDQGEV
jgi:hypothetical protein